MLTIHNMRGRIYSKEEKRAADLLRERGKTYREIRERLGVPKSTLSTWFSKKHASVFNREKQLAHLAKVQPLAVIAKKKKIEEARQNITNRVGNEIKQHNLSETFTGKLILAMLYWAEGSKHAKIGGLKFANSDPKLAQMFVYLLRKCFPINEKRLRVGLYLHYYHKVKVCKKYWSELLEVPENQFWKTYIKPRSKTRKFRHNFMGVCFIYYFDGNIRRELLELGNQVHKILTNSKRP